MLARGQTRVSELSAANFQAAEDEATMSTIKITQGLGAALKYGAELRAAKQIGRLPFLRSSHLMEDVLRGDDGPTIDAGQAFGEFQLDEKTRGRSMFI